MSTQVEALFQERFNVLKTKQGEVTAFWDERDKKLKANDGADLEISSDDKKKLDRLYGEIKDLTAEVSELENRKAISDNAKNIIDKVSQPVHRPEFGNPNVPQIKTAGQAIIENPEYKAWVARATGNGASEISNKHSIHDFPEIDLNGYTFREKGLVYTSATTGGGYVRRDYGPNQDLPLRPLTIRDAITILRTGSNLIEFVRVTSKTRAAAIVPEATATTSTGYSDAEKPEASMASEVVQAAVQTIAVHMPATRQILADAPQLQSMIDAFLNADLELELEEEIISGPGGSGHFTGIENTSGITPQAFFNDGINATSSMIATLRKARTTALITGRTVSTGILMNPYDWEALDLAKDAENRYYWGGPMSMGTKTVWGLPVFESEVIPQGTAYTGNLRTIVVWDRERPSTRVAEQHSDFWTHNMVDILTELRAAMGVLRPASLVKIDLLAGANS